MSNLLSTIGVSNGDEANAGAPAEATPAEATPAEAKADAPPAAAEGAESDEARLRSDELFDKFDEDKDNRIKLSECVRAMDGVLGPLAKIYVQQFTKFDVDSSGDLSRDEVRRLAQAEAQPHPHPKLTSAGELIRDAVRRLARRRALWRDVSSLTLVCAPSCPVQFYAMYLASPAVVPEASEHAAPASVDEVAGVGVSDAAAVPAVAVPATAPAAKPKPRLPKRLSEAEARRACKLAIDKYDLDHKQLDDGTGAPLTKSGKIEMIEALRAMKELVGPLAKNFVSHYTKADTQGRGYLDEEEFYQLYVDLMAEAGLAPDVAALKIE
jgi:hypothetical protein